MKRLLILLTLVFAMATSTTALTAEPADALARTRTIEVRYCWGLTQVDPGCSIQHVVRERGGTLSVNNGGQIEPGTWTYDRQTKTFVMEFDNYPGLVYTGQKRRGCFTGTMTGPVMNGVWEGCFID